MTVNFDQKISVPDDVLFRDLDGEAVLLHLGSEEYFGLDAVGTDMWLEMTRGTTIEEAYANLLDTYDVDAEQLRTDMAEFIEELLAAKLVAVT